jgi:prepilin-type N-terminal cleavage/methylation domain-containing protein
LIKNFKLKIKNSGSGFTMIELLVVIALTAVLATIGFISIGGYRNENHLKDEGSKVAASLQNVHDNSVSQLNGVRWGMRFTNGTSSDTYQQFSGISFASGTPGAAYALGYNLAFGNPATSSEDIIFNPITGALPSDATVNIIPNPANGMAENIIVDTLGQITTRFETNLVGYWPMDEGTGTTAYDASGYGNSGQTTSTTWQTACKVGNCLGFNGTSAYVQLSNLNVNTGSGGQNTVAFWMNWNGASGGRMPFGFSSYDLYLNGGVFGFNTACSDNFGMNASSLSGNWAYVTAIFYNMASSTDISRDQIYINGVPQTLTQSGTPCARSVTTNARVSGWPAGGYYFSGSLDDFRIYNRALSAQEIQDLYNAY